MALQDNLKEARVRKGLSQELVAQRLDVSRQAVTKWEAGQSRPNAKNLQALAELYQTSPEELLADAPRKGPNPILRMNLTKWALILQAAFLHCCTQEVYMLRRHPDGGFYPGAIIVSLVLLSLTSTWVASNHRFEPDLDQRRKNTKMELGYCLIQALAALVTMYFGLGLVGLLLILAVLLVYLLYVNPKFMNRKFTK